MALYSDDQYRSAENRIYRTYGDTVDFRTKGKSLLKFGRGTNGQTWWTVAELGTGIDNLTTLDTNAVDGFSTSDASATGDFYIEGHSVSNGLLTFVGQYVTANGQNKVTLGTPLMDATSISRATGLDGQTLGVLADGETAYSYASDGVTLTAGVPQTPAAIRCVLIAGDGENSSFKAQTNISDDEYFLIERVFCDINRGGSTTRADVQLQIGRYAGTDTIFVPAFQETIGSSVGNMNVQTDIIVPRNSIFRIQVRPTANTTTITGGFQGHLASVVKKNAD